MRESTATWTQRPRVAEAATDEPSTQVKVTDEYLSDGQAAEHCRLPEDYFRSLTRWQGLGPEFTYRLEGTSWWTIGALNKWLSGPPRIDPGFWFVDRRFGWRLGTVEDGLLHAPLERLEHGWQSSTVTPPTGIASCSRGCEHLPPMLFCTCGIWAQTHPTRLQLMQGVIRQRRGNVPLALYSVELGTVFQRSAWYDLRARTSTVVGPIFAEAGSDLKALALAYGTRVTSWNGVLP